VLPSIAVTFPKLVVHAALSGLYGGFVVVVLLRLANPVKSDEGRWSAAASFIVIAVYTLVAAVLWPVLYAALRFFASHRLHLAWLSQRYYNGFFAVNTAVLLGAGWTMLSAFRSGLAPADSDRVTRACVYLSIGWLATTTVATLPPLRRRPGVQTAAVVVALAALLLSPRPVPAPGAGWTTADTSRVTVAPVPSSVAVPAGPAVEALSSKAARVSHARAWRLLLLNLDGADLDTILTMQAEGKLPAFSRLVREGVYGRLASIGPCVAPVTRTTLVTGMLPYRHGVRSAEVRNVFGSEARIDIVPPGIGFDVLLSPFLERRGRVVSDRRTRAFWEIVESEARHRGEVAGWDIDLDATPSTAVKGSAGARVQSWIGELLDPDVLRQKDPGTRALIREATRAAAADVSVLETYESLDLGEEGGVVALSFPGLDRVSHVFLRYARPADFGNVTAREVDLYGTILERYYRRIDGIVADALQSAGAGALVLVSASHGIDPAPPLHRLREEILGGEHLSGVHDGSPAGFLFVHGADVSRGRVFGKGSIADVVPTVLYALGLPVARDSHGSILAGVFSESYTATHPVTVIGSYDTPR
jgi:type I phosphodiesterase/nucleotide pyrophosphatase